MSPALPAAGLHTCPTFEDPRLWRIAAAIVGDEQRAADVLQEAWLTIHVSPTGGAPRERVRLAGVVRNLARNARRAERRTRLRERAAARSERQESTLEALARGSAIAQLHGALERLPVQLSEPLRMRYLEEQQLERVAVQLGRSSSTVKRQIRRGLQDLRRMALAWGA